MFLYIFFSICTGYYLLTFNRKKTYDYLLYKLNTIYIVLQSEHNLLNDR